MGVPLLALGPRPAGLASLADTTSQSLLFSVGADLARVATLQNQPVIAAHGIDVRTLAKCVLSYDDRDVKQPVLCPGIVVDDAEYKQLLGRFKRKNPDASLSALSVIGYSAGLIVLQVLRQTPAPHDASAIARTLRSQSFATPIGVLDFSKRTVFEPVYHVAVPKDVNANLAAAIRGAAKDRCDDCRKGTLPSTQACPQSNVSDVRSEDDCCRKSTTAGRTTNACPQGSYVFGLQ
jgi:hypothetical protein